jgi:malate dehydrogenase
MRDAGAAGGIGQPLSLLLKLSPRIHTLNLYDVVNTAGVKADISHINTGAKVRPALRASASLPPSVSAAGRLLLQRRRLGTCACEQRHTLS